VTIERRFALAGAAAGAAAVAAYVGPYAIDEDAETDDRANLDAVNS